MKTQLKKIQNLPKSLKTKTFLCNTTLTSCLTIALFSLMTSKAAATVLPTLFEVPMNNIKERATTKEIAIFTICVVLLLAAPEEIKKLIRKHNKRKIPKEEAYQSKQSPEPEETEETPSSTKAKETDENESSEQ